MSSVKRMADAYDDFVKHTAHGEPVGLYNIFCPVCGVGVRWYEGCDGKEALRNIEAFFEAHADHRGFSHSDRPWIGFLRASPLVKP